MFHSTHPFLICDYLRIPSSVVGDRQGTEPLPERHPIRAFGRVKAGGSSGSGRTLYWPLAGPGQPEGRLPFGGYRLEGLPVHCRLVPDALLQVWLGELDGNWRPVLVVESAEGQRLSSVWRSASGDVVLPFDPAEAVESCWSERYKETTVPALNNRLKRGALLSYYRLRPLLPRSAQIGLRRAFSRVQARTRFPRWPVEPALHDLYDLVLGLLAGIAGESVPWIAPWPSDHSWAFVLTHDVETEAGYRNIRLLQDIEVRAGYRSSWNFVPRRYNVADSVVRRLAAEGFEVGVHGLYHDGRDLESRETLEARLPGMREAGERWGAVGFRAPATHRRWEWMPLLGFDYDSSYPDTDPFEPQAGGCCTWLPFQNGDLVELPITLPQDHTLFVILRHADERAWVEKASFLRERGGMALLITHPDYLLTESSRRPYVRFLEAFASDPTAWRALPREVSAWWRRRAASTIERDWRGWRISGPAAGEGRVVQTDVPR